MYEAAESRFPVKSAVLLPPAEAAPWLRSRDGRFRALLHWDISCFASSFALFTIFVSYTTLLQVVASTMQDQVSPEGIAESADWAWGVAGLSLDSLSRPATWTSWQAAASYFVCVRVLFALSASPFLLYSAPPVAPIGCSDGSTCVSVSAAPP